MQYAVFTTDGVCSARRPLMGPFVSTLRNVVVLLIGTTSFLPARQPADSGEVAAMSKEEIRFAVDALQSRIRDLTVSFRFDAVKPPPGSLHARFHMHAVVKEGKTYFDFEYGRDLARTFRREVAYNGKRTTIHDVAAGLASVGVEKQAETQTQGRGFFDLMLLNPPRRNYQGRHDQSLVSLLKSQGSRLRERLETVNGHPCFVIDLYQGEVERPSMTVWLDRDRGLLPLRSIYREQPDFERIAMECLIEEAIEVEEGLWLAVKGRKTVNPARGIDAGEYVLQVDHQTDGSFAVSVNSGITDEFFDLWKHLPLGTRLRDKDTGIAWTVGGTDFEGLAEAFETSMKNMDVSVPERRERGSHDTTEQHGSTAVQQSEPNARPRVDVLAQDMRDARGLGRPILLVTFVAIIAVAASIVFLLRRHRHA
jgi:hypothetical protein